MTEQSEKLKKYFDELIEYRDENNKPMTQQGMADKLNSKGVQSLSGKPWSKYSVRRMLTKLNTAGSAVVAKSTRSRGKTATAKSASLSNDEIRARIKQGMYDTEEERFVALPASSKGKGKGKKAAQAEKPDKKKKKKGKKNKKKK